MTERITAAEYQATPKQKEGRVKNAQKTTVDGITFDSKREAKRYGELKQLEQAGDITALELQVPIPLIGQRDAIRAPKGRPMRYVADFRYWDMELAEYVIEDSKGHETETFKMKRAILKAMGIEVKTT